jgi:protoporphyrinogen oxidase
MAQRKAILIGGGPAGLTAAYELLERTDILPIVLERDGILGGIARTVNYKGNRIDIGGHRFFSKSDRVMEWWLEMIPLDPSLGGAAPGEAATITYHNKSRPLEPPAKTAAPGDDRVMLLRDRRSRIYYLRQFFDYPISAGFTTFRQLGLWRTFKIGISYFWSRIFPIKPELNLEQFLINRFGRELYVTFFKSYTEKVWGTECHKISAEWGAQRIKGLNVLRAIAGLFRPARRVAAGPDAAGDFRQKEVETSLIERFLYPKLGPGQLWEEVARRIAEKGGEIRMGQEVDRVVAEGDRIVAVEGIDRRSGERFRLEGEIFFSTMAIKDLARALEPPPPPSIRELAEGLVYRDFLTVGLLAEDLEIKEKDSDGKEVVRDNWIYIQEPDVKVGRLQIFNNWSPAMVADPGKVWVGLEYFCDEGDAVWSLDDAAMIALAKEELARIGILDPRKALDAVVIRMPKTYPAYFGTYDRFPELRAFFDRFENFYLIGRNGMHRYNNQDHSMLTAMTVVDNLVAGRKDKANVWEVNTEGEYHEEKK